MDSLRTVQDLVYDTMTYVQEWTQVGVKYEPLMPADEEGMVWVSQWDNWNVPSPDPSTTPSAPNAFNPIVMYNGIIKQGPTTINGTSVVGGPSGGYALQAGDALTGIVTFPYPLGDGSSSIVTATYRRSVYRYDFFVRTLENACKDIYGRLQIQAIDLVAQGGLDQINDPWEIVLKQAGRKTLMNLQVLLSGYGKTQMEGMGVDLVRAAEMIQDSINTLGEEIVHDVINYRHVNAPRPRGAWGHVLRGCGISHV